ncbi:MAG: Peptidyl-prolyl cis-trans isomerase A [Candidatus Berkelbacteria bacterium Licking1014_7]|uniref:Peptidyl-prolyl cis-trans isomerase n=1 Tax=Candidatus Berkelbacteria bacterium Licking1014_7 TaxID=2017147 RepID=A0A554LIA7_9BACT|nr:MAG: Peptidyl-prolyl cis-trans isomerase A [Candidatus Berkelbacteria bacterium Licking1014_7]
MGKAKKIKQERKIEERKIQETAEDKKSKIRGWFLALIAVGFFAIAIIQRPQNNIGEKMSKAEIITNYGRFTVELYSKDAPKTVENFIGLLQKGYYDNLIFHRVIADFIIQTGDPYCSDNDENTVCGTGGQSFWGALFGDEINTYKIDTGALAMANSGPNTNGSQFFIVVGGAQTQLDGKYTVFGKVIGGMDVAQKISKVEIDDNDKPIKDVVIQRITIPKSK